MGWKIGWMVQGEVSDNPQLSSRVALRGQRFRSRFDGARLGMPRRSEILIMGRGDRNRVERGGGEV